MGKCEYKVQEVILSPANVHNQFLDKYTFIITIMITTIGKAVLRNRMVSMPLQRREKPRAKASPVLSKRETPHLLSKLPPLY